MEGTPLPALPAGLRRRKDAPAPVLNGPHKASDAESFEFSSEDQAILERRLADLGYLE
jgi:hypothetical protein